MLVRYNDVNPLLVDDVFDAWVRSQISVPDKNKLILFRTDWIFGNVEFLDIPDSILLPIITA